MIYAEFTKLVNIINQAKENTNSTETEAKLEYDEEYKPGIKRKSESLETEFKEEKPISKKNYINHSILYKAHSTPHNPHQEENEFEEGSGNNKIEPTKQDPSF